MQTYLKQSLLYIAILTMVGWLTIPVTYATQVFQQTKCASDEPGLSVAKTSDTSVSLSWEAWEGSGNYTVTVTNLTTHQVEQLFQTHLTTAAVSNLSAGDTYRFAVTKNGFVITEDVIM